MTNARKEKLNREFIFAQALKLLDDNGIDSLSFRTLGKQLNVSQTAFYRHVPDKTTLLNGIGDLIWQEIFDSVYQVLDTENIRDWRDVALMYARGLYEVLHRHPNAVVLLLSRPINTAYQFTKVAEFLSKIRHMQIELPANMLSLANVLSTYTLGFAAAEVASFQDDETFTREDMKKVLTQVDETAQEELLPIISPMSEKQWNFSQQFDEGLEALVRGWNV